GHAFAGGQGAEARAADGGAGAIAGGEQSDAAGFESGSLSAAEGGTGSAQARGGVGPGGQFRIRATTSGTANGGNSPAWLAGWRTGRQRRGRCLRPATEPDCRPVAGVGFDCGRQGGKRPAARLCGAGGAGG